MPRAHEVTPQKWDHIEVLYDDHSSSVVFGHYQSDPDGDRVPALGIRWNGGGGHPGYPNYMGNPLWHVVPDFLRENVIEGVREELLLRHEQEGTDIADGLRACTKAYDTLIDKPRHHKIYEAVMNSSSSPGMP